MRNRLFVRSWFVLLCLTAPVLGQEAGPPERIDIPKDNLENGLSEQDKQQIRDHLQYWVGRIRTAPENPEKAREKAERLQRARDRIVQGVFLWYPEHLYRYEVAALATEIVAPLLKDADPHKQIIAAQALARMDKATIQPALETMVRSSNPAVRYWGWVGYGRAAMPVLGQAPRDRQAMLRTIRQRAQTEQSAPVLRALFGALVGPPARPSFVSKEAFEAFRRQAAAALAANWRRWCQRVLAADVPMSDAMDRALAALVRNRSGFGSAGPPPKDLFQMLADLTHCAAVSYDAAQTRIEAAERRIREQEQLLAALEKPDTRRGPDEGGWEAPRRREEGEGEEDVETQRRRALEAIRAARQEIARLRPRAQSTAWLLRELEDACNDVLELSGPKRIRRVARALTDSSLKGPRGAAVTRAASEWIEQMTARGATPPQDRYERPAGNQTEPPDGGAEPAATEDGAAAPED